ncbi:hypothetical protein [Prosthecobacter sp.]|uniref:hypothetical protein n=1 Tax=Prosthecobacter sp. TaxID=1965333 RepID=UPI0037832B01
MSLQKALLLLLLLAQSLPAFGEGFSKSETPQSWSLKQMQHMLADRPVMKSCRIGEQIYWVRQQDSIWQWVAEHFAGKTTRFWTAWHGDIPTEGAQAMHSYGKDTGYLYLEMPAADSKETSNQVFERLWKEAVFELLNLENAPEFSAAIADACAGKCTRHDYIVQTVRLEYVALGKMQAFYTDVWLPWCKISGFVPDPQCWLHNYQPDFETWIKQYPPDSPYPWKYYGDYYDELMRWKAATETPKPEPNAVKETTAKSPKE